MMFGLPNQIPEGDVIDTDDVDLVKRARYLKRCKDQLWTRWRNEYLRGLRDQHDLNSSTKGNKLSVGDVVLIKGDERNRAKWKIGIVEKKIIGKDGVLRGAILRAGRDKLERAIQHLYPLELRCDTPRRDETPEATAKTLNPDAAIYRPKRNAAKIADLRIADQHENDELGPEVE